MTPELLLKTGIAPALAQLRSNGIQDTLAARRLMLAIAMQESGLAHRRQVAADGTETGPASGFFQFERGGGCKGVLLHPTVGKMMRKACDDFEVEATPQALWEAIQYQDVLACIAARLLIHTVPSMLPERQELGWQQYINAWRPGKPHPEKWSANWSAADIIVKANP